MGICVSIRVGFFFCPEFLFFFPCLSSTSSCVPPCLLYDRFFNIVFFLFLLLFVLTCLPFLNSCILHHLLSLFNLSITSPFSLFFYIPTSPVFLWSSLRAISALLFFHLFVYLAHITRISILFKYTLLHSPLSNSLLNPLPSFPFLTAFSVSSLISVPAYPLPPSQLFFSLIYPSLRYCSYPFLTLSVTKSSLLTVFPCLSCVLLGDVKLFMISKTLLQLPRPYFLYRTVLISPSTYPLTC